MTSVTPTVGTVLETVTIVGEGFGTQNCQNLITVGGKPCVTLTSNDKKITCKIDPQDSLSAAVAHKIQVKVLGRGLALMYIKKDSDRRFYLNAYVSSLTPKKGSMMGETRVTIAGGGFSTVPGATLVYMGSRLCTVESVTYTQVICKTTAKAAGGTEEVRVNVYTSKAVCKGQCEYSYEDSMTPKVDEVTPKSISLPENTVTLTGSGFGSDISKINVKVGTETCTPKTVSGGKITCSVGNIPVGNNAIHVTVVGKGRASTKLIIKGEAKIASMSPAFGKHLC